MAEGAVELQIVADDGGDKEKWDYVLMMTPIKPPKDKQGNQLPEDDQKVAKFRDVEKQREEVITALKDPHVGLKVEVRDGSDGDTRYVLLKASQERLFDQAEAIELKMKLKVEYGGGYAPYTTEHKDLFEPASKEHFFSESQRMNLVKSIIQAEQDLGGAGQNINALIRLGICAKIFPLHNHAEREFLRNNWASLKKFYKFQPIDAVRNYYGEEIAIYFAWLGFYTQWLFIASAVGFITFLIWIIVYTDNKNGTGDEGWSIWAITLYSIFIMVWATLFMEFWKRYNHELAFRWGVSDFEATEEQRVDFQGLPEDGAYVNGEWVPFDKENEQAHIEIPKSKYYPEFLRKGKIAAALPLLFAMLIVVCIATASVLSFRLFLQKELNPKKDNEAGSVGGSIIGAFVNSIIIISMNVFWRIVADRLTRWENHRTQTEFDDALTFKIFLFQFVNSYTSLYYIAFFKAAVDFWGASSLEDDCKYGPRPWEGDDDEGPRRIVGWGCVLELTVQLATLLGTNMIIGQTREVAIPFIVSAIQLRNLKKKAAAEGEVKPIPQYERDGKLAPFMGTFDEYSEMVIQFGYITLFAAAFPLAPVLALMNNLVEIRTDAFKLLDATVRPHYKGGQDIGSWYNILEFLGIISVLTNCALLAFTYSSLYKIFDGSSAEDRKFQVFATAVILEHIMLVLKYGLAEIIPDVPGWVRRETAKSDYIKEQTFKQIALKKAGEKKIYQHSD